MERKFHVAGDVLTMRLERSSKSFGAHVLQLEFVILNGEEVSKLTLSGIKEILDLSLMANGSVAV